MRQGIEPTTSPDRGASWTNPNADSNLLNYLTPKEVRALEPVTSKNVREKEWRHSHVDNIFYGLDDSTLGIIVGCAAGAIFLVLIGALLFWTRRRRRKSFDLSLDDINNENNLTVKSEPPSRTSSPKLPKRLSCPDAFHYPKQSMLVRSMTIDRIPDFKLPPERVQPRTSSERGTCQTPLQYQQSLIGSLQPDLYSQNSSLSEDEDGYMPLSAHGRLWYSLIYDAVVEQLSVTLIKVKDIPGRGKYCYPRDPYVKTFLLPDDRACRMSKVRKKTLSPIFNETYVFQVTAEDVKKRVLRFSVYDVDKRKVRHSLGHVMVPLKDVDLTRVDTYWADLEPTAQEKKQPFLVLSESPCLLIINRYDPDNREKYLPQFTTASVGELHLSMCYLPHTEKIKLCVLRAHNLKHTDMDLDTGVYLRAQLFYGRKVHRTKRTNTRPGAHDVDLNESLTFSVSGKQMDSCRIEVALMLTSQRGMVLSQDSEYGHVVLGPFMYARGEELLHWQEMLAQPRMPITRVHALTTSPNHE